jgi:hypothetical protein
VIIKAYKCNGYLKTNVRKKKNKLINELLLSYNRIQLKQSNKFPMRNIVKNN